LLQQKNFTVPHWTVALFSLVLIGISNQLGEFESELTASMFGVVPAVLIGGIGSIIIAVLWLKRFPELLHATKLGHSTD
jgi:peptidoglycan biosynthesis protein MviN/MurJ (putative lipid II flippase)